MFFAAPVFVKTKRGGRRLCLNGYNFYIRCNLPKFYALLWCCSSGTGGCKATVTTYKVQVIVYNGTHNHERPRNK